MAEVGAITIDAPRASYEVNTLNLEVGPIHKQLLDYYNEMHEARDSADVETVQELEQIVPPLLKEFEETECQMTPNPSWLAAKMRAGWYVACGDFEAALAFERKGYDAAAGESENSKESRRRQSVSASNIADQLWRLERAEEGLPWAQLSVELWPTNTINYLVFAIAANHAGLHDEANRILEHLQQIAKFDDEQDALAKCILFERELRSMTKLPAVRSLLERN